MTSTRIAAKSHVQDSLDGITESLIDLGPTVPDSMPGVAAAIREARTAVERAFLLSADWAGCEEDVDSAAAVEVALDFAEQHGIAITDDAAENAAVAVHPDDSAWLRVTIGGAVYLVMADYDADWDGERYVGHTSYQCVGRFA